MKILQLCPYFLPYPGGQERYIHYLSNELLKRECEITILTTNFPESKASERIDNLKIYRYPYITRPLRNPITPRFFFPEIDLTSFDLIHAHNEHSFAANAAVFHKYRLKTPLLITGHGRLVFDTKVGDVLQTLYWNTLGRATLNAADRITVATPSEKMRLVSKGISSSKIDVVPVGVDITHWDSCLDLDNKSFIEKHGLHNRQVLVVATQLIKRKGIQYLISALPEVIRIYPDLVCLIAGSGDFEKELRKMAVEKKLTKHVKFLGLLSDQELAIAYKTANLFLLPSLGEGQPTCIMEAWAFSKPVIATRIEGVIDYYDNVALLVEPANTQGLAKGILHVLGSNELAQKMGKQGRNLIKNQFDWPKIADLMLKTYEKLLTHNGGSQ